MKKTTQPQKRKPVQKRSSSSKNNYVVIGVLAVVIIGVGGVSLSALLNPNATKSLFASINTSSLLGYAAGWNWVIPAQAPPNVQATTPIWTPLVTNGSQCFPPASSSYLPFQVIEQAHPATYPDSYPYWPMNISASEELVSFPASQNVENNYFHLWANRCATMPGSTPGNINQCVGVSGGTTGNPLLGFNTEDTNEDTFSTYKVADDCTLAQEAGTLGASMSTINSLVAGDNITLLTDANQIPGLISSNKLHNVCYIWVATPAQAAANKGIFLDYEVGDRRTDTMATTFLQQVVSMAHNAGRKVILYTNPLDDSYTLEDGIDSNNATTLLNMFDYMSLFLYSGNPEHNILASFNTQLSTFVKGNSNVNFSHMMITFDLGGLLESDAQTVHSLMYQYNIPMMTIFINGAQQGGYCATPTNQKLLCLLYAQCGGTPPTPPPSATIAAVTPNITKGGSTPLNYACSNSSSATLTQVGNLTPVAGGTTAPVAPQTTTTYTLTCKGNSGTGISTTTVTVSAALPDLTASLVPGTTPINIKLGAVVNLQAYVANIGAGPTGKPFDTTFFVNYNGSQYRALLFSSGDPGPGNPPPGGFAAGIKEIDGPQVPIQFTPRAVGHYSFRVCADRGLNMNQTVPQSNATNDCSAWGGINVH